MKQQQGDSGHDITWISTNIIVCDPEAKQSCNKCHKKGFASVLLTYGISEFFIVPICRCFGCVPGLEHRQGHFLELDLRTEFQNLETRCWDSFQLGSLEAYAQLLHNWNQNPRRLLHDVCPRPSRKCSACSKEGASQFCAKCQIVAYCDAKCQGNHWKDHKQRCAYTQEVFHIRSCMFKKTKTVKCVARRTLTLQHEVSPCKRCHHRRKRVTVQLHFHKGFVQRRYVCEHCSDQDPQSFIGEEVPSIPFATTEAEFLDKLKETGDGWKIV